MYPLEVKMKYHGILYTCTSSLLFLVLCTSRSDANVHSFGAKDIHGNEVALKDLSGNVREFRSLVFYTVTQMKFGI